jgi:hypothetical protein
MTFEGLERTITLKFSSLPYVSNMVEVQCLNAELLIFNDVILNIMIVFNHIPLKLGLIAQD